ncbi:hypothetical protein So717_33560 [Roseobacter cerasinus]|uniref:Rhodanese domain-containing protein n=1 Tax=Roseobacter cerasinus TaxID=2602289 RepID=A0A640VTR6_9RHOB|nr:HesA/MoeB/ThiF family protein [Roseobacter cerasinus]GFE51603.1 hypothetical protein So717_33560 [Roseobacter cerasinus]
MTRYARQMMLPEVGETGQARLRAVHVVVVGAGGLGCPALQYLAGAGVGRITILDPDTIEESNLHRQPLYRMTDLGRAKAEAASDALRALNPECLVQGHCTALTPDNAPDLAQSADVVIDAADSFAVSYILSDACRDAGTPLISASALGQSGYVGAFCAGAPSLRAVFPDPPVNGATCATAGVLGPVVGVVGALQAQLALKLLLDAASPALGQMVTLDLANLQFGGFSFLDATEPAQPLSYLSRRMLTGSDMVVDLRDRNEAPQDMIPTALRLSAAEVRSLPQQPGRRLVLGCATGLRAWRLAASLQDQGHDRLALMAATAC